MQFSCFTSFNCTEIVRLAQESITTSSLLTFTFSLSWSQLSVVNVAYVTAGGATFLSIFGFCSAAAAAACCHRRHNLACYVIQSFIRRVVAHCHPFLFFFFFSYWIDLRFSSLFFFARNDRLCVCVSFCVEQHNVCKKESNSQRASTSPHLFKARDVRRKKRLHMRALCIMKQLSKLLDFTYNVRSHCRWWSALHQTPLPTPKHQTKMVLNCWAFPQASSTVQKPWLKNGERRKKDENLQLTAERALKFWERNPETKIWHPNWEKNATAIMRGSAVYVQFCKRHPNWEKNATAIMRESAVYVQFCKRRPRKPKDVEHENHTLFTRIQNYGSRIYKCS